MKNYYLLSAVGPDRAGIVAALTEVLFRHRCNLEDSAMMRLGSEFGVLLIFTSPVSLRESNFSTVGKKYRLSIQLKKISSKLAAARVSQKNAVRVVLHGADHPGIVYHVTQTLARRRFNITDLATHRTKGRGKAGYVLFIEGNLPNERALAQTKKDLLSTAQRLRVTVRIDPVSTAAL